jgi:D-lyxose ketol-isomerase
MRRSQINALLRDAAHYFATMNFKLPVWATWDVPTWQAHKAQATEIFANQLGWDITDFASGDYARRGLLLFAVRNGNPSRDRKPYAEKIMITEENQETPLHFHWRKMEDIINRGGGVLVLQLYRATPAEDLDLEQPVTVHVDGIERTVPAGGIVELNPGESICLEQHVYHRFYGKPGAGRVLVGEVSQVNDDDSDNRFHQPLGRFPLIEEDEPPAYLLTKDYAKYLGL